MRTNVLKFGVVGPRLIISVIIPLLNQMSNSKYFENVWDFSGSTTLDPKLIFNNLSLLSSAFKNKFVIVL